MSPKLSTSFRSHGKWGDLLVCFIPLSWCTNILSNSNFILRMIEWQSESSLFTLRIRGKQWYWIYKFELKSLVDVSGVAKNLGHNLWAYARHSDKHHLMGLIQAKHNLEDSYADWFTSGNKQYLSNTEASHTRILGGNAINLRLFSIERPAEPVMLAAAPLSHYIKHSYNLQGAVTKLADIRVPNEELSVLDAGVNAASTVHLDITRTDQVSNSQYVPVRVIPSPTATSLLVKFNNNVSFEQKPATSNFYLVVKQKRYLSSNMDSNQYTLTNSVYNQNIFKPSNTTVLSQYSAIRSELPSAQSNRRLLRTRRVLVLPAHTNITLITNSFDVMHSWFIPGLGVKLDCVPGRSTHHTIHIDHAGFYYGQCAEICGRYHHHMPIRVCALPFEHFLIWWYHYGVPFFLAGNQDRTPIIPKVAKQMNW